MRIISGQLKGRKILKPIDKITRPLKDLVKESIFNIINHTNKFDINLKNANILDLFSGVGSFGLEALSREAQSIVFVENYSVSLSILKKNINSLNLNERCKVIEKDITKNFNFKSLNVKFDLIFLDPPFKAKYVTDILLQIYDSGVLKKNGIVIIHRDSSEKDKFPLTFKIVEEKKYGSSKIIFGKF